MLIVLISGLQGLYYLTRGNRIASFYLEDHNGEIRTANYTNLLIGQVANGYTLRVSDTYIRDRIGDTFQNSRVKC